MLHFYVCGFNGFGQIASFDKKERAGYYVNAKFLYDAKAQETVDICVSWSSMLLLIKTQCGKSYLKSCVEIKPVENLEKISTSNQYILGFCNDGFRLYDLDKAEEIAIADDELSTCHYDDRTNEIPSERPIVPQCKVKELFAQENVFYSLYVDGSLNKIELSRDPDSLKLNHTPISLPIKTPIKQVSCGKEHVILLTENSQVFTFGLGSRGQLGNGDVEERMEPQEVDALSGVPIKTVSAGGWHSIAVSEDGDLYTWGWNESGQLGLPCPLLSGESGVETRGIVTVPTAIDLPASVHKVSCGSRHSVVLLEDKALMASGWNKYGQLRTGDITSRDQFTKLDISNVKDSNIIDIVAGHWNTVFIFSQIK